MSIERGKQIQGLVQFHVYLKPNPDYTALSKDLKELRFSSSEIYQILREVHKGKY